MRAHLFKFYCYLPPFSKDYEREIKKIKSHPKHKHSSTYLYNFFFFLKFLRSLLSKRYLIHRLHVKKSYKIFNKKKKKNLTKYGIHECIQPVLSVRQRLYPIHVQVNFPVFEEQTSNITKNLYNSHALRKRCTYLW